MKILFLSAEASPLVKVGGLGDVAGSLPAALIAAGHDVRVAIPGYGAIDWARWKPERAASVAVRRAGGDQTADIFTTDVAGVPFWLITGPPIPRNGSIYGSGIAEDGPKFVFFSLASLWAAQALGFQPDVIHAHDFHASAAVYWIGAEGRANPYFRSAGTVLTIHNLPYSGQGAGRALGEYFLPAAAAIGALPPSHRDSLLALGILAADEVTTVSPTYAREILTPDYGHGLDGLLRSRADRLTGILNGLDTRSWDPARDDAIAARYDLETLERRGDNKAALQEEAGLEKRSDVPLVGVVSRLDWQKGLDVAAGPVRRWVEGGGQFVMLGTGEHSLEQEYAQIEQRNPGTASVRFRFDGAYARRIYAGADALLIPSRYEPCGLTQMIAMRYGTVPVARRTGGLADTIVDAGDPGGTGILFDEESPPSLWDALERMLRVYSQPARWSELQTRGMRSDFSWNRSAARYAALYEKARGLRATAP
ncbi:MAG TPA: glycogen synthase [Thermoanaerobaculia bacterium]|nr:glycogen synthase [Thermoanaerobaculia bacterium]